MSGSGQEVGVRFQTVYQSFLYCKRYDNFFPYISQRIVVQLNGLKVTILDRSQIFSFDPVLQHHLVTQWTPFIAGIKDNYDRFWLSSLTSFSEMKATTIDFSRITSGILCTPRRLILIITGLSESSWYFKFNITRDATVFKVARNDRSRIQWWTLSHGTKKNGCLPYFSHSISLMWPVSKSIFTEE